MPQDSKRRVDWVRVGSIVFGLGPTILIVALIYVEMYAPAFFWDISPATKGTVVARDLSDTPLGKILNLLAISWIPLTAFGMALYFVRARAAFLRFAATRAAGLRPAPCDRP